MGNLCGSPSKDRYDEHVTIENKKIKGNKNNTVSTTIFSYLYRVTSHKLRCRLTRMVWRRNSAQKKHSSPRSLMTQMPRRIMSMMNSRQDLNKKRQSLLRGKHCALKRLLRLLKLLQQRKLRDRLMQRQLKLLL